MAACKIVNAAATKAVSEFKGYSEEYKSAAETFVTAFTSAIAEMEGEAKDALETFFNNNVKPLVLEDIPSAVDGMSQLLEANRSNFEAVDKQIADSIAKG